jgi:hypothetical protein
MQAEPLFLIKANFEFVKKATDSVKYHERGYLIQGAMRSILTLTNFASE